MDLLSESLSSHSHIRPRCPIFGRRARIMVFIHANLVDIRKYSAVTLLTALGARLLMEPTPLRFSVGSLLLATKAQVLSETAAFFLLLLSA